MSQHDSLLSMPSSQSLVVGLQSSSPFFTRLSGELRTHILIGAFGNRTIHVNNREEEYLQSDIMSSEARSMPRIPDCTISGTICSRYENNLDSYDPNVAFDKCTPASAKSKETRALGEDLTKPQIGAIGWLFSCRQAYIEGVDVLYSNNTFCIACPSLSADLSRVFPKQRLARIRALEFAWDWRKAKYLESSFDEQLGAILFNLPSHFPRLVQLSIAFQDLWPGCPRPFDKDFVSQLEEKVLQPLDRVIKSMDTLQMFKVYFASSVHSGLRGEKGLKDWRRGIYRVKYWRGINGSPKDGRGFWICEGRNDKGIWSRITWFEKEIEVE